MLLFLLRHLKFMRVLVTGVPGTGKSSLAPFIAKKLKAKVIAINEVVKEKGLYSRKEGDALVAKMKPLEKELARVLRKEKNAVVEGHLGCEMRLPVDLVIVTRTNPKALEKRLRARGYAKKKIAENVLAEALDYATAMAEGRYMRVFEVDTTRGRVGKAVESILRGRGWRFKAGWVRWRKELEGLARARF